MAAAVFLKDNNYSVLVFEKETNIGGHCNTYYFTPPKEGDVNFVDLGVQEFQDTDFDNAAGLGTWTLSSKAFVERFAKSGIVPFNITAQNAPTYGMDLNHGIPLGPNPLPVLPPGPDFAAASEALFGYLSQYPWLNTADIPEQVPEDMLIPFSEFIAKYNLTALTDAFFIPILFHGGLGDFSKLTSLYALLNLSPSILALFNPQTSSAAGFSAAEGCADLYSGIEEYLGKENVIRNANTFRVNRDEDGKVTMMVKIDGAIAVGVTCSSLIIAFPETLESLRFMDLDYAEFEVFKHVATRNYYDFAANVSGPLADQPFNFANVNVESSSSLPTSPSVIGAGRSLPYGPIAGLAFADHDVCFDEMETIIKAQMAEVPPYLFTAVVLVANKHVFQPHFNAQAIKDGVYNALTALQGHKHTYWLSALVGYADSTVLWQKAYTLVQTYFPKK